MDDLMQQTMPADTLPGEELPEELQDLIEEMRAAKMAKVEQVGKYVAKLRDEAVRFRRNSGIEQIWTEDEEYYEGIDEFNRDSRSWLKSPSSAGGITRSPAKSDTRCTSFFNITRQFVDAASSRMGDILLPAGDWNFSIGPTPVQDQDPAQDPQLQLSQGTPQQGQIERQLQQQAEDKAEKGETKIRDWLTECVYHGEVRKVIESAAKLGTGILKGPVPERKTHRKMSINEQDGTISMEMVKETVPVSKWVDCWDAFPDPACGDYIHDGSHFIERDRLTAKGLQDLKGQKGYLADQIDIVLDEGPGRRNYTDGMRSTEDKTKDDDLYEVWYFYGMVDVVGLAAMNVTVEAKDSTKKFVPAVVTLVNDTAIQAYLNPMDSGEFPYDFWTWQRMTGTPWGTGVSRQVRTPQDMLNAGARALMDNAGLASGPQLVFRKGAIIPANGRWEITPRKVWYATEQADTRSVSDAIMAINIPMIQQELMGIVELAMKMAEDSTGLVYLLQGQQGSAPDTVGGMELLNKNAAAPLRRLARLFDVFLTEPHIRRYYEYLLLYGPEECKGDFKIQAIGSTALVEREIQAIEALALLQLALNPAYGLDPEKAMTEVLKAKRMIPEKWLMDDSKKEELAQKPQVVPAIEVAKIRAATDEKRIQHEHWKVQVNTTAAQKKAHDDMDRDLLYADTMARRDQTTQQVRMEELRIKRELALLDYANKRGMTLDQIKADLARESMKLKTQKELAGATGKLQAAPQVATPSVEPPQHARDGHAFEE